MFVGIDLGTTATRVSAYIDDCFQLIGKERSCVAFTDDGVLIGDAAICCDNLDSPNVVFDIVKLIGRKSDDPIIDSNRPYWPFKLSSSPMPKVQVQYKGELKELLPEQIIAMLLSKMIDIAQKRLSRKVTCAAVTVPAYFNGRQRQAIKVASTIAG